MKKIFMVVSLGVVLVCTRVYGQVSINTDGSAPKSSAILDVKSTDHGFLPPRVALVSKSSASPITNPNNGLLVFDTVTVDVEGITPGYYFWSGPVSGGSWTRFSSGAPTGNLVTKTASGAILKTEGLVLASAGAGNSYDITLTLPVVTAADNGLSITVKNTGVVQDLITVVGNGTAKIDGVTTGSSMTRWKSNTYIAYNGDWLLKDKQARQSNLYEVSPDASFTTIAEALLFLVAHDVAPSTLRLMSANYPISSTQSVNLTHPLTIEGTSFGENTITVTGSNPGFNCATECYFKMLNFDGTGATGDGIVLSGSGEYYEIKDCSFTGFANEVSQTGLYSTSWIFETDFDGATSSGINLATGNSGSGTVSSTLKVSECDFTGCVKGINLVSGYLPVVSILNSTFYNSTLQTGIVYVPATFSSFTSMFITNNAWNNVGTFTSGYDFTLANGRDSKAFIENNAGMESKRPHCKINVINNGSTTTISPANTWTRANWTNTSSYTCKWTIGTTGPVNGNRIQYQPVNTRDVIISITGNMSVNGNARVLNFCFCKNGVTTTRYGEETMYCATNNQMYQFSTIAYISDVAASDYFEFFVTSGTNNDQITVSDVNLFANSQ